MKKIIVFLLCIWSFQISAQKVDIKWSEKEYYENKTGGFFDYFTGANSKNIYTVYTNFRLKKYFSGKIRPPKKIKIITYSRINLKRIAELVLYDSKQSVYQELKEMRFYKAVIFEKTVYVFWIKESKIKDELFAQTFTSELKPVQGLKKIYELKSDIKDSKKAELFAMGNNNNESIVIGGELPSNKESNVIIEYIVLNKNLSNIASKKITLPKIVNKKSDDVIVGRKLDKLTSYYRLGDDGNLHITSYSPEGNQPVVKYNLKNISKKDLVFSKPIQKQNLVYSIVDLISGNIKTYPIKFKNKNIYYADYRADTNSVKILGFFSDSLIDSKGKEIHGIVYGLVDNKTFNLIDDFKFNYFTKEQLENINNDKEAKKNNITDNHSFPKGYIIENVQTTDKNSILLFCSIMENYVSKIVNDNDPNGGRHCEKRNITVFKINNEKGIEWVSNLTRFKTYNGFNFYDLKVIKTENKFIVTYASDNFDSSQRTYSTYKNRKTEALNNFEYAVFDNATGMFTKGVYTVNANSIEVDRKRKNIIVPTKIRVMDNQFYLDYSSKIRMKKWPLLTFPVWIFMPPAIGFLYRSGYFYKGYGYIGKIDFKLPKQ